MPVLAGVIEAGIYHLNYSWQILQLLALHVGQELAVMELVSPLSLLEKEANLESFRPASALHSGQGALLSESLSGRNNSNSVPHSGQAYSYIGIFIPSTISLTVFRQSVKLNF